MPCLEVDVPPGDSAHLSRSKSGEHCQNESRQGFTGDGSEKNASLLGCPKLYFLRPLHRFTFQIFGGVIGQDPTSSVKLKKSTNHDGKVSTTEGRQRLSIGSGQTIQPALQTGRCELGEVLSGVIGSETTEAAAQIAQRSFGAPPGGLGLNQIQYRFPDRQRGPGDRGASGVGLGGCNEVLVADQVGGLCEDGAGGRHVDPVWRNKLCCALQVPPLGSGHSGSLSVSRIQPGNHAYSLGPGGLFVGEGLPAAFAGGVVGQHPAGTSAPISRPEVDFGTVAPD